MSKKYKMKSVHNVTNKYRCKFIIKEKCTILTGGSIPTLLANTRKGSIVVHTRPTIFTWELVAFVHIYFLKINIS